MRSLATRKRNSKADPWVKTNRAGKWAVKQRQAKEDLEGPEASEKSVGDLVAKRTSVETEVIKRQRLTGKFLPQ